MADGAERVYGLVVGNSRGRHVEGDRRFYDLLAYAPGLNNTTADLAAVLDAEARSAPDQRPGKIDAKAKSLLDAAAKPAWRTYTVPAEGHAAPYAITFDGAGRYAWSRTLASGLGESVVCDGKEIVHIYAELGLAARRAVSRHHRLDLAARVPSVVPSAEDLAHGADITLADESTVAVVPHHDKDAKKWAELRLVFAKGTLSERQVVEMPAKKVLYPKASHDAKGASLTSPS